MIVRLGMRVRLPEVEELRYRVTVLLLASVSMCFKPSPPQRMIISGQREISIKRYTVERTNKAETRPEEQSEKAESCLDNL